MSGSSGKKILARRETEKYVGRETELQRLADLTRKGPTALLAQPCAGTSELLRETYDRIFRSEGALLPIYFQISRADVSAAQLAFRFAREFLSQLLAFQRRSNELVVTGASLEEIRTAAETELSWLGRSGFAALDPATCFTLPIRAAAAGHRLFLMLDDLHLPAGESFLGEVKDRYAAAGLRFVVAGHRRFIYKYVSDLRKLHLEALQTDGASRLVNDWCSERGLVVTDECSDLLAVQLGGRPGLIGSVIRTALDMGVHLDSYKNVQQAYTQAVLGGSIGRHFDDQLAAISPLREDLVAAIAEVNARALTGIRVSELVSDKLSIGSFSKLHAAEMVNLHTDNLWPADDLVLSDYVSGSATADDPRIPRATLFGQALTRNISRAPRLMARHYRFKHALPLKEIIQKFSGQTISPSEIDHADSLETSKSLATETLRLPFITFAANTESIYPDIGQLLEPERCAIGMGFEDQTAHRPIAWIAAEIESKFQANAELAEFWCDRLEMAALSCGISDVRTWLIAPEGFEPEAAKVLRSRNGIGSSRAQALKLHQLISSVPVEREPSTRYEMVIPADDNSELLGAKSLEEIARKLGFNAKTINQMKTALIEACINASEHSLSPDRKIRITFSVEDEKFVITVANRGLRLSDKAPKNTAEPSERRGWGLKVINGLMDEVRSEYTDDGTILRMAKRLPAD